MSEPMLPRPIEEPFGKKAIVSIPVCNCGLGRRGPVGGVCRTCSNAIPSVVEKRHLANRRFKDFCGFLPQRKGTSTRCRHGYLRGRCPHCENQGRM